MAKAAKSTKKKTTTKKKAATKAAPKKTAATQKTTKKAAASNHPSYQQIAARAYEIYADRVKHGRPGTPEGDWLEAEKQLGA
jgi:hypothetical protein